MQSAKRILVASVIAASALIAGLLYIRKLRDERVLSGLRQEAVALNLQNLAHAIEEFTDDFGRPPWPADAPPPRFPTASVLRELAPQGRYLTLGAPAVINASGRTYFVIPAYPDSVPVDAWSRQINMYFRTDRGELLIWSNGPNRRDETSDVIAPRSSGDGTYGDDIHGSWIRIVVRP